MWFYAKEGREVGPVPDGELDSLAASGVIDASTLVWKEGMAEWLPLATARPGMTIPKAGQEACSQCGTFHSPENLVALSGLKVCGACKPEAVQRIREGVPLPSRDAVRRHGKTVEVEGATTFPARCIRCNTASTLIQQSLNFARINEDGRLIRSQLRYFVCSKHKRLQRTMLGIGAIALITSLVFCVNSRFNSFLWNVAPVAAALSLIGMIFIRQGIRFRKNSAGVMAFEGCGKAFLDSLHKRPN